MKINKINAHRNTNQSITNNYFVKLPTVFKVTQFSQIIHRPRSTPPTVKEKFTYLTKSKGKKTQKL